MSTTINYKGNAIATVTNATKTLNTAGTWVEGDIQIVDSTTGKYTATVTSNGTATNTYIEHNSNRYKNYNGIFTFSAGDTLLISASSTPGGDGEIRIDGVQVASSAYTATYTYTLPAHNINVAMGTSQIFVTSTLQSKTVSYTPSESAQTATVTADTGYDGLSSVAVSVGAIPGTYVGSQVPTQAAQTIHPSTSAQTIASGKYLTGNQTIEAVTTTNLTAANIKSGVVVKVGSATDDDCVVSVTGTAETGGATLEDEANTTGTTAVITGTAGGISVDDIATNAQPSGAITLNNSISTISHNAFVRKPITSITSACTTIQTYAFQLCASLKNITFQNCTSIQQNAFDRCTALITANIPSCTNIGASAFNGCTALKTVILPNSAITIGANAFYGCTSLENCDFSNIAIIQNSAFRGANGAGCTFNPTTVNDSGFRDTTNFNVGFFPRLTTINGTYGLAGCFSDSRGCTITAVVFPVLSTIAGNYSLSYDHNIAVMDIGNLTTIQQYTFRENDAMSTLILRKSSITTLSNINAFQDTPFASGGTGGTIYVPSALIDSYKAATNWSTLNGYGTVTWAAIEGSQYENYYADGTAISS